MSVNQANLERAIKAALEGPEERDLRIADYRFNVKPAEITRHADNSITVVGGDDSYISRRRRGRPNDRIFYEFDKVGDEVKNLEVDIDRGGFLAIPRRYRDEIKKAVEIAREIWIIIQDQKRGGGVANFKADETAQAAATAELKHLLDGSWQGESAFLVANIVLRAK